MEVEVDERRDGTKKDEGRDADANADERYLSDLQEEIRKLKTENAELEKENLFLKKARAPYKPPRWRE